MSTAERVPQPIPDGFLLVTRADLVAEYAAGHRAGFIECLDELEGLVAGGYRYPLPSGLKSWVKAARRRSDAPHVKHGRRGRDKTTPPTTGTAP